MEKQWSELHLFQADVWQAVENSSQAERTEYAGTLYIERGKALRLDYQRVMLGEVEESTSVSRVVNGASFEIEHVYLADTNYLLHIDKLARVMTKEVLAEAGLPPLLQALAGASEFRAETFRENYYIDEEIAEEEVYEQPTYQLRFRPKGPRKETLVEYRLWVSRENSLPVRMDVLGRDEQVRLGFFNLRTEVPLPENVFRITRPPGVAT